MESKSAEKKTTILKDAMALFIVTLISAFALSFVYELTKAPIAKQDEMKKQKAYQAVYEDTTPKLDDKLMNILKDTDLKSLDAAYKNTTIDEINDAYDSNGKQVGYILKVSTKGYKDTITLTYGYSLDGTVQNVEFLALNDTAGLGMNAAKPDFIGQFSGKTVDKFEVTKTGAASDNQIDAISSATITSRAVTSAVNAGIAFLKENAAIGGGANE
jgi:electron transport complex protein RnfG